MDNLVNLSMLTSLMPLWNMTKRFALVKYGGGIVQLSGSIAGNTYARNRYGNYVRARTVPTNPQTARQETMRAIVAALADRWSESVTIAQRTAWGLYGDSVAMKNRLGEVVHLSGYNHYIRSNSVLMQIEETIVDAGPTIFELPDHDPTFAIVATESGQTISYTFDALRAWANEVGGFLVKYQGSPQNGQRNFFDGPWRLHGTIDGAGSPPSSPDEEASPPFAIAEGQAQWCYARIIRADGRLSEKFRAGPTLVVAGV